MSTQPPYKLIGEFERILSVTIRNHRFYQFTDWKDIATGREYSLMTRKEFWVDNLLSFIGTISHNGRDAQVRSVKQAVTTEQREMIGGVVGLRGPLFYDQELGVQRWSVETMDTQIREAVPNLAVLAIPYWYTISHPNATFILVKPSDFRDIMVRHALPCSYFDGKDWLY